MGPCDVGSDHFIFGECIQVSNTQELIIHLLTSFPALTIGLLQYQFQIQLSHITCIRFFILIYLIADNINTFQNVLL